MDGGWNVVSETPAPAAPAGGDPWRVVSQEPMVPSTMPPQMQTTPDAEGGIKSRILDYAQQAAKINRQIDNMITGFALPASQKGSESYNALVKQRDALVTRAKDLTQKAQRAGVKAPDFKEELGKAYKALKPQLAKPTEAETVTLTPREAQEKVDALQKAGVPESDPRMRQANKERAFADAASRRSAGELFAPFDAAIPGLKAAGRLVGKIPGVVRNALGGEAKKAVSGLRSAATGTTRAAASQEEQAAAKAGAQADKLKQTQQQVEATQPRIAAQRAEQAVKPPAPGQQAGLEKQRVAEKLRQQTRDLQKQYEAAGMAKDEAEQRAASKAQEVDEAKSAAEKLDQDLTAQPGMSKEEFGQKLESAVRDTNQKYSGIRARESGYAKAIADAGDTLHVETKDISDQIDRDMKDIANDATLRLLGKIKKQLNTIRSTVNKEGDTVEKAHEALTIKKADSLRKTLDEAIRDKMYDGEAVSKEALAYLKGIRKQLTKTATEAWEPYKVALGKFSTLSRPLDFIQKNGLLRKVAVSDPAEAEKTVTRAQIVGKLVQQANKEGRDALRRLIAEDPSIREAARLYFSEDLFGPAGERVVKSPTAFRSWLVKNKPVLEQLGIYDEFRGMSAARKTAQQAVDRAAGVAKQTKGEAKAAAEREEEIGRQLKQKMGMRGKAVARAETKTPTAEERTTAAGKRAEKGVQRLEAKRQASVGEMDKALKSSQEYRRFEDQLTERADEATMLSTTQKLVDKAMKEGKLSRDEYRQYLKRIEEVQTKIKSRQKARTMLKSIGAAAVLTGLGYDAFRWLRTMTGH